MDSVYIPKVVTGIVIILHIRRDHATRLAVNRLPVKSFKAAKVRKM